MMEKQGVEIPSLDYENRYTKGKKQAIYLAVSFYTGQWARTWIIWPVAAVLFAALLALRRMLRQPR